MKYNRELEKINNQEKAYFLGLMYADGCISSIKRKNSNYVKYQCQISLTDENLIKELKEIFPFFNLQEFDFGRYKSTWNKQFALRKANFDLFNDLKLNGIIERKSGENSINLKLPIIDKELLQHFIRGLFDGDGSINIPKKRPNTRFVEICSSSLNFLLQVKKFLEDSNITCPIIREKHNNKNPLYVLEWINHKNIKSFGDFIYKDSIIHLKRKKEKFDSHQLIDRKDYNPLCKCGGKSIRCGKRIMKNYLSYRYKCITCNKRFSVQAQIKSDELLEKPEEVNQQPSLSLNV